MKIILAPTDFSKTARNSINYAAEIAIRIKAKLVLFHAFHAPVIISEAPIVVPSDADLAKDGMKRLKKIKSALIDKHGPRLHLETVCEEGLAVDVVGEYAAKHKADLIVMGTHGAGLLEEKLIGSVTSALIKKSGIPVLSIADKVKFKRIKKLILATDYGELKSLDSLDPVKDLARLFRSHIYVLNITDEANEIPGVSQAVQGIKIHHILAEQDHSFHSVTNKNVIKGIKEFAASRGADLLIMVPRKHNFLQTLFKERHTKSMLFHTGIPLLTIHE